MNDLDSILLIVFGTLTGIFGLLFLMAALEPKKITPEAEPQTLNRNPRGVGLGMSRHTNM